MVFQDLHKYNYSKSNLVLLVSILKLQMFSLNFLYKEKSLLLEFIILKNRHYPAKFYYFSIFG